MTPSDSGAGGPGHTRSGCLRAFIVLCGLVLLLPGVCSVITAVMAGPMVVVSIFSGQARDPYFWPVLGMWLVAWGIGLLIGYLGLRLIAGARGAP